MRLGTDAEFSELRSALAAAGYTEAAVCSRLGLDRISKFQFDRKRTFTDEPADAIALLVRLLVEGGPVRRGAAPMLPLDELAALGVVAPLSSDSTSVAGTVMLYPAHDLYIVSDRVSPVEGEPGPPPEDIVYPAIIPNTDLFLDLCRPGPCDSFLDLCSGTGIGALVAARAGARHAYAFDITERSTHFAEFNCRINGITNVTSARGDVYEPAGELTFDRIVAHPPYVPVYRPQLIFDSGGQDGEQITRRIVEGLPRYLRPGGRFHALMMGSDRDQPFEHRLREWLGSEEREFDVAFVNRRTLAPREYAAEAVIKRKGPVEDITAWRAMFDGLHVQALVYGFVTIQRRDCLRPVFTVRRQSGPRSGSAEHAWLVDWETVASANEPEQLLSARLRASPEARLRLEHRIAEGAWIPEVYHLETEYPFSMEMRAQAWTAHLLTCADGSLTSAKLLEKLKADGALHPDTPAAEFARMLAVLVSGGFLQV
jgi:methylase of polypeptide subunit release factors